MVVNTNDDKKAKAETEFLRNGIPSIVLAITTILLTVYSIWIVQPSISVRYRKLCDTNLSLLGLTSLPANGKVELARKVEPAGREKFSLSERERLLLETQLSLRRLANIQQTCDSIRFESAITSLALAECYRERAWELSLANSDSKEVNVYLAKEHHAIGQASEFMRMVQRLNGPWAIAASVWLIDRQLLSTSFFRTKELAELELSTRKLLDLFAKHSDVTSSDSPQVVVTAFYPFLARIATLRSLDLDLSISDEVRVRFLTEANEFFEQCQGHDIADRSWRALAKLPFDSDKARDWAWEDVQSFWSRGTVERPRSEELASVLRGLLVGGNFEEAQSFVLNQLKKLPWFEQSQFRERAAATCLRQLVANKIMAVNAGVDTSNRGTIKTTELNDANNFVLLDLAIRLQPEASGLPELLIDVAIRQNEESLARSSTLADFVQHVIEQSSREGLNGILEAIRMAQSGNSEEVERAIRKVLQDDVAYGVLATRIAMTLANSRSSGSKDAENSLPTINHEVLVRWLQAINDGSPNILSAWFARGSLHLNAKEFDQAIECLEHLAKRVPDSEEVQEMLETARVR